VLDYHDIIIHLLKILKNFKIKETHSKSHILKTLKNPENTKNPENE
jgi:hypothetical protein